MASAERRWLSARIGLRLVYRDDTEHGSAVSGLCERRLQSRFAVFHAYRARHGLESLVRDGEQVLGRVLGTCLEGIREPDGRLRPEWLYPDPAKVTPAQLRVERGLGDVVERIALGRGLAASLARYLGDWQRGARPPPPGAPRDLWHALVAARALVTTRPSPPAPRRAGARFVGHATVLFEGSGHGLLVDPFLLPRSARYRGGWQPLGLGDLGPLDAVLVTHSHPDHFDLGTLLRCGADTPIYVPVVARESVLAIDMRARLEALGFQAVHGVGPWERFRVGTAEVTALPFYGEQPTVGERLHPEVRNEGLTYLVEADGRRYAALADAGRDDSGDVKVLAARARKRYGPLDVLFGGYRGFALHPVRYVFSSVSRYLPFVPAADWGRRQQIMCDAADLLDVGERWGAARIVPYAAGGAPWYWLRGLGPRLDGSAPADPDTDPLPGHVLDVARRRGSAARVVSLRAGDRL